MQTKTTFEKTVVGGIEVKNRIFRSATHEGTAKDGKISDRMLDMYRNLAEGDVGLIITGYFGFSKTDYHNKGTVVLSDDSSITGLEKLTETVHQHGSKIVTQINHAGSQLLSPPDGPVYGPSEVVDPFSGITSIPFSVNQISDLVTEFSDAAVMAQKAGFDGVQIHGAHGYLLNKFLSPAFNKRTDDYGGSPVKNARIVLEILEEIKLKCGKDYPVWIKLNSSDFHPTDEGLNEEDFLLIVKELSKNGIDAIEVSGGTLTGKHPPSRSKKHAAYHLESAEKLAEDISIPVILVGGLRNIDTIDRIMAETKIAAISMSRPLIREPRLVERWAAGDRQDAACIACNGCFNPNGTICFFELGEEEKAAQKEVMKFLSSLGKKS